LPQHRLQRKDKANENRDAPRVHSPRLRNYAAPILKHISAVHL
jgi:hypothetical protein